MLRRCLLLSPPRRARAADGRPGPEPERQRRPGRRPPDQDPLQGRCLRALPDGRSVVLPRRHRRQRCRLGLRRQPVDRGLDAGQRPQRLERQGLLRRVLRGRRRLVSQELPPPERRQAAVLGGALRVGQLPLQGLPQRQADRQEHRRLPAVRDPPARRVAQARRHEPAGDPRRRPPLPDRLPALGPVDDRRADRRLVELRRPAARGLPAQDRSRGLQHRGGPARPAVRHLRRPRHLQDDVAQLRRQGAADAGHRTPGRAQDRARHGVGGRQEVRDVHQAHRGQEPQDVVAHPARTSTTRP